MKKILYFLSILLVCSLSIWAITPPNNLPNPANKAPVLNADGGLSIHGDPTAPSQVGLKAASGNNYTFLTAPDTITATYRITFPNSPTNGVFVGTVINGTNVVLSSVSGITQTMDVLVAGGTTNRLFISNGIITNVTISL